MINLYVDEELEEMTMQDLLVVLDHATMTTVKMSKYRRQRQVCLVKDPDLEMTVHRDPDLEMILRDQNDQGQETAIMLIGVRYIPAGCDPSIHLATSGQHTQRKVRLQ